MQDKAKSKDKKSILMADAIRFLSMDAVQAANSGHPGMPMGMADVATVLFKKIININPKKPDWPDRDRFVLSAGHGSMLLYALHYLLGYEDMPIDSIKNFRQLNYNTAGHPEYGHAKGIETTTGPLGQGLATAVGMALAEKLLSSRFGSNLVDHYTYVIAGDGCLQEGISHEAIEFSGHLKLSKLIEKLNIEFLKRNFHSQSELKIQKYNLDINSRELIFKEKKIKLTEKESNIILYISNSIKPVSIQDLQLNVWGYHSDLETHTVETHIYRLRKKFLKIFDDKNFIVSKKDGYQII